VLAVPEDDQQVVFMTPEPDAASSRAFRYLAGQISRAGAPSVAGGVAV
jgi:hypothetical protein